MMEHERWGKYFATSKNIECFSELIKIAQFYFSVMALYANVDKFFSLMQRQNQKEREILLAEPISSDVGVEFKTSFMQAVY